MAKRYVNGYDKPRFILINSAGAQETIDLTFKYNALKEYYEDKSLLDRYTDGSKSWLNKPIDYEWRLLYTDYLEKDDSLKLINKIENATRDGKRIILIPHIDYAFRLFEVFVLPEKREIDLHLHQRGSERTVNKGWEISFVNSKPINRISVADPDDIPVSIAVFGEEF